MSPTQPEYHVYRIFGCYGDAQEILDCRCKDCIVKHFQHEDEFKKPCYMWLPGHLEPIFIPALSASIRADKMADMLIAQEDEEKGKKARRAARNKKNKMKQKQRRRCNDARPCNDASSLTVKGNDSDVREKACSDFESLHVTEKEKTLSSVDPPASSPGAPTGSSTIVDHAMTPGDLKALLTCPGSQRLLTDAVIAADGHSYDRRFLEDWFCRGHLVSPVTLERLPHTRMVPNHSIKTLALELLG